MELLASDILTKKKKKKRLQRPLKKINSFKEDILYCYFLLTYTAKYPEVTIVLPVKCIHSVRYRMYIADKTIYVHIFFFFNILLNIYIHVQ